MKSVDNYHQISMSELGICPNLFDNVSTTIIKSLDLISEEKTIQLPSIKLADAVEQFKYTDYSFFVYKDIDDNNNFAIIYRKDDDTLSLIRCY